MIENPGARTIPQLGRLGDGLLALARDRVRDARHVMRRLADDRNRPAVRAAGSLRSGSPRALLGEIARLSDTAITQAQSIVVSLAPAPMRPYGMEQGTLDPHLHFRHGAEGALRFRREIYCLIHGILERLGLSNPLIHETRLGDVHHAIEREATAFFPAAYTGDDRAACRIAARLASELAKREPIVHLPVLAGDRGSGKETEIASFCYVIVGLAYAVAWTKEEREGLIEGVVTAALARREGFSAALSAANAEIRLAELFGRLAPHLP